MTALILQQPQQASQILQVPDCLSEDIQDALFDVLQHLDKLTASSDSSADSFAAASSRRMQPDLERLCSLLLTSAHQDLLAAAPDGCHLTIVGDCQFQRIPWESLPIHSRALGLRFAVGRRLQSQTLANSLLPHSQNLDRPLTGTGCVPTADSWQLISVDLEQRIVERRLRALLYSEHRLSPLNEAPPELTVADFSRILSENTWVHFAGHADSKTGDQQPVCELVLATSRSDTNHRITYPLSLLQGLQKVPQALFLNACGALQLPEANSGLAPASLTSLLLQRGTQILIGPIVRVADSASRKLVAAFYDTLATGVSVGEALRQARLAASGALPPLAVLPLAYVLYGHPDFIPFPTTDNLPPRTPAPTNTTEAATKSVPDGLQFPCPCSRCGTLIRTRHGNYQQQVAATTSANAGPLCRNCARETPNTPRLEPSNTRSADIHPTLIAPQLTEAEQLFCAWLEETLLREWPCRIPNRTQPALCRFSRPLAGPTHLPESTPVACLEVREMRDQQNQLIETVAFALLRTETPATTETLTPLLRELAHICPGALLVVAAAAGFTETLLQQFQSPQAPAWQPTGSALIFWQPSSRIEHRRRLDLRSLMFPTLLCRQQTHLQIAAAVSMLSQLLPLAVSYSAPQLATEWKLEIDAVEQALQLMALQHQLQLDQHPEYGLVISPTELQPATGGHTSRPATDSNSGKSPDNTAQPTTETWLQRLKAWRK